MDFPYEYRVPLGQMRKVFRSFVWLCLLSAFVSLSGAEAQSELTGRGHSGWISSLAYFPDGKRLASGSADKTVKIWTIPSGEETATLRGHTDYVSSVAISPDGKLLATGSFDKTAKLWHLATNEEKASLHGHRAVVSSVAFSPDGKTLAAGIRYGTVILWDMPSKKERATLKGHKSDVWSVAFFPDGKILASADGDWDQPGKVKLWEAATGQERGILKHTGEV